MYGWSDAISKKRLKCFWSNEVPEGLYVAARYSLRKFILDLPGFQLEIAETFLSISRHEVGTWSRCDSVRRYTRLISVLLSEFLDRHWEPPHWEEIQVFSIEKPWSFPLRTRSSSLRIKRKIPVLSIEKNGIFSSMRTLWIIFLPNDGIRPDHNVSKPIYHQPG